MYSLEELKDFMYNTLPEKRFLHVLSVAEDAEEMAQIFSLNKAPLLRAALLHDCTKPLSYEEHLALCEKHNFPLSENDLSSPEILHAVTGALVAKNFYGESDEVFSMIYSHSTGKENMTIGEKIIFLADFMEKTRTHSACQTVRRSFFKNIEKADTPSGKCYVLDVTVFQVLSYTLDFLKEKNVYIHKNTEFAKAYLEKALSSQF